MICLWPVFFVPHELMHKMLLHDTTPTLQLARYSNPRDARTTRRDAERDAHTRQPASTCTAHTSHRTSHISPTNTHSERLLAPTRRCARALQKRHARACATPCCTRCRALAARRDAADARGRQPQPSCHRDTPIVVSRSHPRQPLFFFCGGHTKLALFFPISFLGRALPVPVDFPSWPPCAGRLPAQAPPRPRTASRCESHTAARRDTAARRGVHAR